MATITATATLDVEDLPNTGTWFANAAAWKEYWRDQTIDLEFDGADTTIYAPVAYNTALVPCFINIDGVDYTLITVQMFNSFMASYDALNVNYQLLRNELKAAGLITNSQ